jgi:copper chaperone CopZ
MKTYELSVANMTCQHCAMKVKNTLEAIGGLTEITVDLFNETVVLKAETINQDKLQSALAAVGYPLQSVSPR